MPFAIIKNDITKVKADAIVNTANPEVAVGTGVDHAIYEAAGKRRLFREREKIGRLAPGEAAITPAFRLDAKYIIHVSGPRWEGGDKDEAKILRQCYDKALSMAYENGCDSIAFPLLATGSYGFPKETGIQIAVDAFLDFLIMHEMEIWLVVIGDEATNISGRLVGEVASFIDDRDEMTIIKEEYDNAVTYRLGMEDNSEFMEELAPPPGDRRDQSGKSLGSASPRRDWWDMPVASLPPKMDEEEEEEAGPEDIYYNSPPPEDFVVNSPPPEFQPIMSPDPTKKRAATSPFAKPDDLDSILNDIHSDAFGNHLQRLINKKGLKNSEVYAAANISKQYFSKLLKGQIKPSKEKLLALSVGLHLNMDEAMDFLKAAGYAFSPLSKTDAVVSYFIKHRDYNVMKIDIVLFDYGLEPLSCA